MSLKLWWTISGSFKINAGLNIYRMKRYTRIDTNRKKGFDVKKTLCTFFFYEIALANRRSKNKLKMADLNSMRDGENHEENHHQVQNLTLMYFKHGLIL